MKVILLKDTPGVGHKYEVKDVASGYARNFLFAKGMAEIASPSSMRRVEARRARYEKEKQTEIKEVTQLFKELDGKKIQVAVKANEKGVLFSGIGKEEILSHLKEKTHTNVSSGMILLDTPIKKTGEHTITLFSENKKAQFILHVDSL